MAAINRTASRAREAARSSARQTEAPPHRSTKPASWSPSSEPPEELRHPRLGEPSTAWPIRDLRGCLFALHARWDEDPRDWQDPEKQIRWWRNGKWKLEDAGVADAPLYRSEDIPSFEADSPVFLVEGEKAADALADLGVQIVATCCGAASAPGDEALDVLRDRHVVLWPDNDEAGRAHMLTIAEALRDRARSVRWLDLDDDLPEGGDAVDWLGVRLSAEPTDEERGWAREELEGLVAEAPAPPPDEAMGPRAVRLTPASAIDIERARWLWSGRLPLGAFALLGGREGDGKSLLSVTLAAALSRGALDGDLRGAPRGVVLATTEESWSHVVVPRLRAADADLDRVYRCDVEDAAGMGDPPLTVEVGPDGEP